MTFQPSHIKRYTIQSSTLLYIAEISVISTSVPPQPIQKLKRCSCGLCYYQIFCWYAMVCVRQSIAFVLASKVTNTDEPFDFLSSWTAWIFDSLCKQWNYVASVQRLLKCHQMNSYISASNDILFSLLPFTCYNVLMYLLVCTLPNECKWNIVISFLGLRTFI